MKENIINPFKGKFELSKEQVSIIEACRDNDLVSVEAVSGAAKTTSLVAVSHNIKKRSLFLTFSKALADEAKREFPNHVDCRTLHSLAYRYVGKDYKHKLTRPQGKYKNLAGTGGEIAKYFKVSPIQISEDDYITSAFIGGAVKNLLTKYENSFEDVIDKNHVDYNDIKYLLTKFKDYFNKSVQKKFVNKVVSVAKKLWKLRIDVDSDVVCTHDTYQKLYVLSKPVIDTEVLYVDEVQDCSYVSVKLVLDQIKHGHCKVIVVGDRDQSIYGWRGAVMLNDYLKDNIERVLSHSFRYGDRVADLAMKILDNGKNVVGFDKVDTKLVKSFDEDEYDKVTILYRTNAALVDDALVRIENEQDVNIEIDLSDYLSLLDSINALKTGNMKYVKHYEVLPYDNYETFKEDVANNPPIKRVFEVVERGDYWRVKELFKNHQNHPKNKYTLVTAHKSKGRTFPNVILGEDFPSNYNSEGEWVGLKEEEKRLLYVAATRVQNILAYNNTVKEIIDRSSVVEDTFNKEMKTRMKDLEKDYKIYK